MGIPKFYRYLSERYPLINEIVTSDQYLPECDYLYLDLNGVIHNATHDNSLSIGRRSDETIAAFIMGYISHIFKQIKPKKMMFLAVDGVAPRAKLNQQRSRRFRSATDSQKAKEDAGYTGESFDSNCITPGTEFMAKVDEYLEYMIHKKVSEDPLWRNTSVLYSSHSDPGEGEHKIMSFIRGRVCDPDYNEQERHCIYGLDADLILLSLSLHDVNVVLLREVINFFSFVRKEEAMKDRAISKSKWQILHVSVLRKYMMYDLTPADVSWIVEDNKERLLDDFVMLMILLGNDFLPELPSLDINEGSVQYIIELYKEVISTMHGFLSEKGKPIIPILHALLAKIGKDEGEVFLERSENEKRAKRHESRFETRKSSPPNPHPELCVAGGLPFIKDPVHIRKTIKENGGDNYRNYYYYDKLNILLPRDSSVLSDVCKCYYEGIQWVVSYYYRGVPSWSWYYPYHYSPLASDLTAYNQAIQPFEMKEPFLPFMQQLGCLPPQSSAILPSSYRPMVLNASSPIIDFYPPSFSIDMNGKKNPWEGVNLIPFIDEKAIVDTLQKFKCNDRLTEEEKKRNCFKPAKMYHYVQQCIRKTYPSPLHSPLFPDIMNNHCTGKVYEMPRPQGFQEEVLRLVPLPGTADIELNPKDVTVEMLHIQDMGRFSKHKTVVINKKCSINGNQLTKDVVTSYMQKCFDSVVCYSYPVSRYARIVGVYTKKYHAIGCNQQSIKVYPLKGEESTTIRTMMESMKEDALHGRMDVVGLGGVAVESIELLLELQPIIGIQRDPVTECDSYRYATNHILYPAELTSYHDRIDDSRYLRHSHVLSQRAIKGDKCIFLGDNSTSGELLFGAEAVIEQCSDSTVTIRIMRLPSCIKDGHIALNCMKKSRWYSANDLRQYLKISARAIIYIGSYYRVTDGDHGRDIGLGFFDKRGKLLPKYCRWRLDRDIQINEKTQDQLPYCPLAVDTDTMQTKGSKWIDHIQFSKEAVHIMMDYRNQFRELFERIRDSDMSSDVNDLIPNDCGYTLRNVYNWVSNLPYKEELTTPYSSVCASPKEASVLAELHSTEKEVLPFVLRLACKGNQIATWDRENTITTITEKYNVLPLIGDRLVIIGGNDIPFGSYGYIIAIHPQTKVVEVVMDNPFIGGTDLHGLLPVQGRGGIVPWRDCIFLSQQSVRVGSAVVV